MAPVTRRLLPFSDIFGQPSPTLQSLQASSPLSKHHVSQAVSPHTAHTQALTSLGSLKCASVPVTSLPLISFRLQQSMSSINSPQPSNDTNSREPPKYLQSTKSKSPSATKRLQSHQQNLSRSRRKNIAHRQPNPKPRMRTNPHFLLRVILPLVFLLPTRELLFHRCAQPFGS